MDEAERLCDRLVIMDRGKVLVEGSPAELIRKHVGRQVIEVNEPDEAVCEFLRNSGLEMDDLGHRMIVYSGDGEAAFHAITERFCAGGCMLRQATLEDVFLRLTGRDLRE
jgi:lipooligosaccharide transport system ATP-binding protein